MKAAVTYADLEEGRVWRINTAQLAMLSGNSAATWERHRCKGTSPIPFQRDETGHVFYLASDVVAYLKGLSERKHRSTAEYATGVRTENVAKARDVQDKRKRENKLQSKTKTPKR